MTLTLTLQPLLATPIPTERWEVWFQTWWGCLVPDDFILCDPPPAAELTLRLTDAAEMHQLNSNWRALDRPTDVLAFAALEGLPSAPMPFVYLGDIAIGVPIAQAQAEQEGHSLEAELAWLASHGLLHLLGWDHSDGITLQQMVNRQLALLEAIQMNYSFDNTSQG
jgi:probable rRNA maturation factor